MSFLCGVLFLLMMWFAENIVILFKALTPPCPS